MRFASFVVIAVLAALPEVAAAQGRNAQMTTGMGLVGLGVYAALADRDCPYETPSTIVVSGRCYAGRWTGSARVPYDGDPGDPLEIPKLQLAGGLVVAGVGGLMAGGLWSPSREMDVLTAMGLGVALVAGAFDYSDVPGTVHADFGGQRFSTCQRGNTITDRCTDAALERRHMLFAGFGALGLGVARWFWSPSVRLDVTPGSIRAANTITW